MQLTNVVPDDIGWVDTVVDRWECSQRWSLCGQTPPMPLLWALLWDDVTVQQAVRGDGSDAVALLQLVNVDLHNGVAGLGVLADPDHVPQLQAPVTGFLARVFRDFPLRKLTFGAVAGELRVADCFGNRARRVGRFHQHQRRSGDGYADLEIYEVWEAG